MARTTVSRRAFLTGLGGAAALALAPTAGRAAAEPAADPAVINDWNKTSIAVITLDAGKANAEGFFWFGYVQAAVYNAVVGITRRYQPYRWNARPEQPASPQAAAAAAAHRVLQAYFGDLPAAQARLAEAYAASLAALPDDDATWWGLQFGEKAADHFVALRADDGRYAPVTFDMPPAPGVWRPTPPANAPFAFPWLARMTPLMLETPDQFRPPPQPAMTSAAYTADFNEVKALGAKESAARTPRQTETALFITGIGQEPYHAALRDLTVRYGMDISDRARLFAAVNMCVTDTGMAVWDSKLHYGFWRPITAIRQAEEDGNPATAADAAWEPLIVTPPYPDYVSGLNGLFGSSTRALTRVLGTERIDLTITLPALNTTRYYEFADQLRADAVDCRVFAGIHFRFADEVAKVLGMQVADWALDRYFMPM